MDERCAEKKDEHLLGVLKNYAPAQEVPQQSQTSTNDQPVVQFRFRPPFMRTSKHDARGDAINMVMKNMAAKSIPLWAAHIFSNKFADEYREKLSTGFVGFVDGVYDGIDAGLWCRQVTSSFDEFMKEVALNEELVPVKPKEWDVFAYSLYTAKNRKPKMEDRHIILPTLLAVNPLIDKKFQNDSFFAVFDGHNGAECASYAATHFYECLLTELNASDDKNDLMVRTFDVFDKRLTLRCKNEHLKSGTTACCVFISEGVAYLGWCGDSSIGIFKSNCSITTVTTKHTPDQLEEKQRIEAAGGMVINIQGELRVNGVLNISRSLGDIGTKPIVSSQPDTDVVRLTVEDRILLLSSDGIWETLTESEIAECVVQFVKAHPYSEYDKLSEFIGQKAKEEGTADNLTLIAVFLGDVKSVWDEIASSSTV